MERGVVFGRSMLGYDVKDGRMTINPEGAELVRLIFHKYGVEQKGTSIIARELREAGYKTLTGNTRWNNSHIVKILKNEKYVGDLVQKKTYTPDYLTHQKKYNDGAEEKVCLTDHHEPIIDRVLWNTVQSELQRRNRHGQLAVGHGNAMYSPERFAAACAEQPSWQERNGTRTAPSVRNGAVLPPPTRGQVILTPWAIRLAVTLA